MSNESQKPEPDKRPLDLSLPPRGKPERHAPGTTVLLILLLGLGAASLVVTLRPHRAARPRAAELPAKAQKELALKLEKRDLHESAVAAWKAYLGAAELDPAGRAKIWYRIGLIHEKAGDHAAAIASWYRSEAIAEQPDLAPEIARRVQECYEKLGKVSVLKHDLADRTALTGKPPQTDAKVVAEIGPEKITMAELDKRIEAQVERRFKRFARHMKPEVIRKQKEAALRQLSSPEMKKRQLTGMVIEEILYRRARELKLADTPKVRAQLADMVRSLLAQAMLQSEVDEKVRITETDRQTYYEAHKGRYVASESARISHFLVRDQSAADTVYKKLKAGEKYDELASRFSLLKSGGKKGRAVAAIVHKDDTRIGGIGEPKRALEAIFSTKAGQVCGKPFRSRQGLHIIKVLSRDPKRQKSFQEVRAEVEKALRTDKEREVLTGLLDVLRSRYDVVIHDSAFETKAPASRKPSPSPAKKHDPRKPK